MNPEYLGPMMFFVASGCIFLGYPVAFTLGGTALLFGGTDEEGGGRSNRAVRAPRSLSGDDEKRHR